MKKILVFLRRWFCAISIVLLVALPLIFPTLLFCITINREMSIIVMLIDLFIVEPGIIYILAGTPLGDKIIDGIIK